MGFSVKIVSGVRKRVIKAGKFLMASVVAACCCVAAAGTTPCSNCLDGGSFDTMPNTCQAVVSGVSFTTSCDNVSGVKYFNISGGTATGTYCLNITDLGGGLGCIWSADIPSGQWPTVVSHNASDCSDTGTTETITSVKINVRPSGGFMRIEIVITTTGGTQPRSTFSISVIQNPTCVDGSYSNITGSTPSGTISLTFGGC